MDITSALLGGVISGSDLAAAYGTDDQVIALAARIEAVHSKAELMGADGCLRMAQISLATGARALPEEAQEIMVWPEGAGGGWQNQDSKTPLIFALGFDFYHRVAWERGGFIQYMQPRDMTAQERKDHGVLSGGFAQICKVVRREDLKEFRDLAPYKELLEMLAVVGIGVMSESEIETSERTIGRSFLWKANRRATKDALRLAFGSGIRPVMMNKPPPPTNIPNEVIDEFSETHDAVSVIVDKQVPAEQPPAEQVEWGEFVPSGQKPIAKKKQEDANDIFFSS